MTENEERAFRIDNDVIADLAGHAAMESYGVVGMAAQTLTDGLAMLLSPSRLRNGISIKFDKETRAVSADLYIIVEHGVNIIEVSKMLRERVEYVLRDYAQLEVKTVKIHVQGVKVRSKEK